ncbi:hypothetical protein ACQPZQ_15210 [Pseudonocardia sp. CA-142604]
MSSTFLDPSRIPEAVWARLHPTVDERLANILAAAPTSQCPTISTRSGAP